MFQEHEIEPILIKGLAISIFYPEIGDRTFVDTDLAVSPDSYDLAKDLLISAEFLRFEVDLHSGLRHLDSLEWNDLFEHSQIIKIRDYEIRVLCPEDHLRVVCVHWLTNGGEFKDRLLDVYYLVKNRPEDFDWDRCLNLISKRRRKWIVCTLGLTQKYFGLDLSDTPIEEEAKELPGWLVTRVEKEWSSDLKLLPLAFGNQDLKTFYRQIRKRLPPNPITSTVMCEGDFDSRTRIFYQTREIVRRLGFRRPKI